MSFGGDSSIVELPLFQGEDGGAIPTSPLQLLFRPITNHTANLVAVESHYAHRKAPITWAFGAFFNNNLVGIITFGKPPSQHLCIGVCGRENQERVYELNRLWMNDICPKNSESRFIGWALRELSKIKPPLIIVSYADTEQNHSGIVYRSTNWIYTGQTKPVLEYQVKGIKMHSKTVSNSVGQSTDKKSKKQMLEELYGDNFYMKERSKKHRFVYFCNPKDRMLLKWDVEQPKTTPCINQDSK